jgi:hypothetical protein
MQILPIYLSSHQVPSRNYREESCKGKKDAENSFESNKKEGGGEEGSSATVLPLAPTACSKDNLAMFVE